MTMSLDRASAWLADKYGVFAHGDAVEIAGLLDTAVAEKARRVEAIVEANGHPDCDYCRGLVAAVTVLRARTSPPGGGEQ